MLPQVRFPHFCARRFNLEGYNQPGTTNSSRADPASKCTGTQHNIDCTEDTPDCPQEPALKHKPDPWKDHQEKQIAHQRAPSTMLSHVVLLIRQNYRSSQPPPALGHLGVTRAHQDPPYSICWKAKKSSSSMINSSAKKLFVINFRNRRPPCLYDTSAGAGSYRRRTKKSNISGFKT